MLKIKNVSKKFGNKRALAKTNFEIKSGEVFSLIGPNGSGKTTLVKMISGLLRPTDGQILINGFDIVKKPQKAKSQIGYIPDEPNIWSKITAEEFLHFVGALFEMDSKSRSKKIKKCLKIFDLEGIEKNYFEDLSRGNKQKFSILAALLHEPKLLLIDEPIVGLDPKSADIAKKTFASFAQKGRSVLMVTHTLSVAQEISDRIGILHYGKLIEVGTFSQLQKKAKLPSSASLEAVYKVLTEKSSN